MVTYPNMPLPKHIYQDGPDFYHEADGHIWSAPVKVGMSLEKAIEARKMFLEQYNKK